MSHHTTTTPLAPTGPQSTTPAGTRSVSTGAQPRAASRWWLLAAWLTVFVMLAGHNVGQMTFDTKLGVNIDPVGFYARLATLWNPLEWFGGLQNQYIGYAFPMGAFALLGHALETPVWLVERLWMSLLAAAGFWGTLRLAEALRIGSPRTRLMAGAVFALWPTYTILIGSTSAAVVPGLLAPWAVLPLVTGSRTGSVRLAAARSGLVVLAMGGVNAASTIAALVLPALFLLTRPAGPRRRALLVWWPPALLLATAWWLVPLLFQGRYGFNFLPYIEQAANTTQTMSASAVLRGSGNWVAYLHFGSAWLSAGWAVVSGPLVIVAVSVVAATGLFGLARRDLAEGRWLRLATGFVVLVMLAGYAGPLGGLFHGTVQNLLDGALAPFRNVYKFEPVLALTLVLGLAHGLTRLRPHADSSAPVRRPALPTRLGRALLACSVLIGFSLPYLSGEVLQPGAFVAVPDYWTQAATYLAAHSPTEPAMVVPADSHGVYTWGTPVDEPLEPLASSPWVQRGQVPFSGGGAASMLNAAERAIESGSAVPGLPAYLARAGIRYLVVRNDLDPTQLGYTPPKLVHDTLGQSGFHRVAAFGPQTTAGFIYPGTPLAVQALMTAYPAVEVFQADTAPPVPFGPVATQSTADTVRVAGDPGSLLQLIGQGSLTDQPVVAVGDNTGIPNAPTSAVVTDGYRRQDTAFGLIQQNTSYTYTATGTNPPDDPHGGDGGPPRELLSVSPHGNQTVSELTGAAEVTASSYGSWLAELPGYEPVNAFDGDPATAWTEGQPGGAAGQSLAITFDHQVNLPATAGIHLLDDTALRPLITTVTTTTAAGSATTNLAGSARLQDLRVPAGPTSWLRITIQATTGKTPGGLGAGITDVDLPGVHVTRYLAVPPMPVGAKAGTFSFHRDTNPPLSLATGQPESQLARTFTTSTPLEPRVSATTVAVPGAALNSLVDSYRPAGSSLRVTASSTWGALPQFRASNLIDGDYRTSWVAGGPNAVLQLSWSGKRTVNQLFLLATTGLASAPTEVRISSPAGTRQASVGVGGEVNFPALNTDQLDISFPTLAVATTFDPVVGRAQQLPVGLTELYLPALSDLRVPPPNPATSLNLACGQGPPLTLDGRTYLTSVSGTVGDLTGFNPLTVTLCTPSGTLKLAPGKHWLSSPGSAGPLAITDLSLSTASPPPPTVNRAVTVLNWAAQHREVRIAAGGSTYLAVHQVYDAGWTASLNGTALTPVQLDGWQQGFVVPAGTGGVITLSFPAGTAYAIALAGSGVGVLALAVCAVLPTRPVRRRTGKAGAGARAARTSRSTDRQRLAGALVAVTVLFLLVGGIAALVVPVLAVLGYLRPNWLPWVAAGAMLSAGICTVAGLGSHVATPGFGAFGAPAQVFALVALATALCPVIHPATERTG
ncbi:alpha-(1-_3)-arabinofuranosyltransferase domain-containing protein [Amycolatopsis sp. H20-H5]|uniref:alpha-(1->3)-arabinofuranosyltransferase domain-containing protein n=1 Tax=Amycolatopsis sp. H20-H5 TaxID=3046309 RepID=UPI002DB5AD70|nr:alpha-(1->3)-arabinofuranosyltransferase family protein [Amycolatopsis sp. H20-H5]MEC3980075.1 alpha-(1->3)-arabinofuranosyltransferase family protein [Amycolatopsis sp. H20-H5]